MERVNLSKYTDVELSDLEKAIWKENNKRREVYYKRINKCPELDCADGYTGSEMDHYPCERCKTTGKYSPIKNELNFSKNGVN